MLKKALHSIHVNQSSVAICYVHWRAYDQYRENGHSLARVMFFEDDLFYIFFPSTHFGEKVAMGKMTIINIFGPVLINGRCIGYMLADCI